MIERMETGSDLDRAAAAVAAMFTRPALPAFGCATGGDEDEKEEELDVDEEDDEDDDDDDDEEEEDDDED
jgi:hypothetical protein